MKIVIFFFVSFLHYSILAQKSISSLIPNEKQIELPNVSNTNFIFSPFEKNKIWYYGSYANYELDLETGQSIDLAIKLNLRKKEDMYYQNKSFQDSTENYYWITQKDTIYRFDRTTLSVKKFENTPYLVSVAQTNKYVYFASQTKVLVYERAAEKMVVLFENPPFSIKNMIKHPTTGFIFFNSRTYLIPELNTIQNCSEDGMSVELFKYSVTQIKHNFWKNIYSGQTQTNGYFRDYSLPCIRSSDASYSEDKDGFWIYDSNGLCFVSKKESSVFQIDYPISIYEYSFVLNDSLNLYYIENGKLNILSKAFLRSKMQLYQIYDIDKEKRECDENFINLRSIKDFSWQEYEKMITEYESCFKVKQPICNQNNTNQEIISKLWYLSTIDTLLNFRKTTINAIKNGTFPKKWLGGVSYLFREKVNRGDIKDGANWAKIIEKNYGSLFSGLDSLFLEKCKIANRLLNGLELKDFEKDEYQWKKAKIYENLFECGYQFPCYIHLAIQQYEYLIEQFPQSQWCGEAKYECYKLRGLTYDKEKERYGNYEKLLEEHPTNSLKLKIYPELLYYLKVNKGKSAIAYKENLVKAIKYAKDFRGISKIGLETKYAHWTDEYIEQEIKYLNNSLEGFVFDYEIAFNKSNFKIGETINYWVTIKNTGSKERNIQLIGCDKQPYLYFIIEPLSQKNTAENTDYGFCELITPNKCKIDYHSLKPQEIYKYQGSLDKIYFNSEFMGVLKFMQKGEYLIYINGYDNLISSNKFLFRIE